MKYYWLRGEKLREKNRSDSEKIFVGCFIAGLIMLAFAVISGLMEVYFG